MQRRSLLKTLPAGVAASLASVPGWAQQYPARPIRLVVPYPAGGNTDVTMREVAKALSARLGQTIVVDNKPGANGIIGTDAVAKAPPDGHTLLTAIGAFTINPLIYKTLPYTPEQLAPVSLIGRVNLIMAAGTSVPAHNFAELVAWARTGVPVSYDSSGVGSALHLIGERISQATGMRAVHVPYKGITQSLPDLVSGRLSFTINTIATLGPFIRDGKLTPIAVLGRERTPELPQVPTIIEAGYPALEAYAWQGVMVPARTPEAVIERLSSEITTVLKQPEMRQRLAAMGLDAIGGTPAEFAAFLKEDTRQAAAVVKQAGIVVE